MRVMIIVLGLVLVVSQAYGGTIPITNGDFESNANGDFTGPGDDVYAYSGVNFDALTFVTGIPGWYTTGASTVGLVGANWLSGYYPVIDSQAIVMPSSGAAYTEITLAEAAVGATVTFSVGTGSPDYAVAAPLLNVALYQVSPAGPTRNLTFDPGAITAIAAGDGVMTQYTSDPVDLPAAYYQLGFLQVYTGSSFVLDNVSMSAVPEPSVFALAISALLVCAWRRRK